jgi:MoxR-like ATPase
MKQEIRRFPYYVGAPQQGCAQVPAKLDTLIRDPRRDASSYIADPGLVDTVNVALLLGQPLLLTGEPGTGKTQLAFSLGCELGYEVYKYETKSTSSARDLFYTYDTLGRFHAAQIKEGAVDGKDYISYNALGLAVLRSREFEKVQKWLPIGVVRWEVPARSVVLVDEIDKAPRDFPNDLLNELDEMYFKIPELGMTNEKIVADENLRPVIVVTSNSEKGLPDAFLRRCIYYDIPFPEDPDRLKDIVLAHAAEFGKQSQLLWLDEAIGFFKDLRKTARGLEKKPSTAELLNWLAYLGRRVSVEQISLRDQPDILKASVGALFKTASDRARTAGIVGEWIAGH